MFGKLAALTGSGWKGYTAGIGLMMLGVVMFIDAIGIDMPSLEVTIDEAFWTFLSGMAAFGIRHTMD